MPTTISGSTGIDKVQDGVVTPDDLVQKLTLGTVINTTSGTYHDTPTIPSWVKRITVGFAGVSTNGASSVLVQLGHSGGVDTTGYLGAVMNEATVTNFSTGFSDDTGSSAIIRHGAIVFALIDPSTNQWSASINLGFSNSNGARSGGGSKTLAGALTKIRITTGNGTDIFDAGSINILYEG